MNNRTNASQEMNVPDTAFGEARSRWFENYGSSIVDKRRYFFIALVLGAVCIVQALAITTILPLKEIVPYVIGFDKESGGPKVTNVVVEKYKPGEPELRYFLAKWVTKLLTIDRYTMQRDLNEAYYMTRGKASDQFTDFMGTDNPVKQITADLTLARTVEISSVNFVSEGAVIVRVTTTGRSAASSAKVDTKKLAITVHYIHVPPKTEKEIFENPLGLFVTHFAITKEL